MTTDEANQLLHGLVPLTATLDIAAQLLGPDAVELSIDWAPELCTAGGVMHGGVMMTLADTAGALCAFYNLPGPEASTATIESKTNFIRALLSGTLTARATPIHVGSTTIVVGTDLTANGELVAKVTQTQLILESDSRRSEEDEG